MPSLFSSTESIHRRRPAGFRIWLSQHPHVRKHVVLSDTYAEGPQRDGGGIARVTNLSIARPAAPSQRQASPNIPVCATAHVASRFANNTLQSWFPLWRKSEHTRSTAAGSMCRRRMSSWSPSQDWLPLITLPRGISADRSWSFTADSCPQPPERQRRRYHLSQPDLDGLPAILGRHPQQPGSRDQLYTRGCHSTLARRAETIRADVGVFRESVALAGETEQRFNSGTRNERHREVTQEGRPRAREAVYGRPRHPPNDA